MNIINKITSTALMTLLSVSAFSEELGAVNHIESTGIWQFDRDSNGLKIKETWVLRANSKYVRFVSFAERKNSTALDDETGTWTNIDGTKIVFIFDSDVGGQMEFQVRKSDDKYFASQDGKSWSPVTRILIGKLDDDGK